MSAYVRFVGGPWDGVEFDAQYVPCCIQFRDYAVAGAYLATAPLCGEIGPISKREHHQYLMNGHKLREGVVPAAGVNMPHEADDPDEILAIIDQECIVTLYRYAPGERWEW